MEYIRFFLKNKRLISFGFILTFFSSFGQTFLISLYVPEIMNEFNLSSFSFGMLYGAATITSAFTLAYVGKFIDNSDLRNYTLYAVLLLIASCLLLGFSVNSVLVFLGLWGLRLGGQGLFSHISKTSMSKIFHNTRGKALSLSVLGHSAGESVLPSTIGVLIGYVGWRVSMFVSASVIGVFLLPVILFLLAGKNIRFGADAGEVDSEFSFSRWKLIKDKRFYIIAINPFILYFTITGLFFHQLILAQEKGWAVEWIAGSFLGFALGRTVFSFISGKLIDRFGALKIFPFYLMPLVLGLLVLATFSHPLAAPVYFIFTGISVGLSSTLNTAVLAEVYGTRNLGGIKSALSFISVFSTALSPGLFGFILDSGFSFGLIAAGSAFAALLVVIITYRLPRIINYSKEASFL